MTKYFHRQIQLWGEDTQLLLKNKKIAIIGSGGLGSSLAFALGSSGIGEIHMIDFDKIEIHNIHRQLAFMLDDEDKYKSDVNVDVIKKRNPFVNAFSHTCGFEKFSKKNIEVDLIIDATDNLETRSQINLYAKEKNIPWLYGSVEAFNGQVCFFEDSSFNDVFRISSQTPAGIAAPMVMHIASLQANLALRYLAGLSVKKDILYYLYFSDEGELVTQKFNLPKE